MTKIRMDWKNLKLEMKGHAGSGPAGNDLPGKCGTLLCQLFDAFLIDVARKDVSAVCGEFTGDQVPHSQRRAGNDDIFVFEIFHRLVLSLRFIM